jgi:hypothetical protein
MIQGIIISKLNRSDLMQLSDYENRVVKSDVQTKIVNIDRQLGKTTSTIFCIKKLEEYDNVLVIFPTVSHKDSYINELNRFFVVEKRKRGKEYIVRDSSDKQVTVYLMSVIELYNARGVNTLFDLVIIEEAQNIKHEELKVLEGFNYADVVVTGTMPELREKSVLGRLYVDYYLANKVLAQGQANHLINNVSVEFFDSLNLENDKGFNFAPKEMKISLGMIEEVHP